MFTISCPKISSTNFSSLFVLFVFLIKLLTSSHCWFNIKNFFVLFLSILLTEYQLYYRLLINLNLYSKLVVNIFLYKVLLDFLFDELFLIHFLSVVFIISNILI